jgi:hypothetical protein
VPNRYLPIYLNDHLAGATLGVELGRRALRQNRDDAFLQWLVPQLEEDRHALLTLMDDLGVRRSVPKAGGAWLAEKLGRLKLNGHIASYSPLSRLVELEGLASGIDAKLGLWRALSAAGVADVDHLADRAREQRERLEPLRLEAARACYGGSRASA